MCTLYTSVGKLELRKEKDFTYPVITVNHEEFQPSPHEFVMWMTCCWQIFEVQAVFESYMSGLKEAQFPNSIDPNTCLKNLLRSGLIVRGDGEKPSQALYALVSALYIVPRTENKRSILKRMYFLLVKKQVTLEQFLTELKNENYVDSQDEILEVAGRHMLSTAELIQLMDTAAMEDKKPETIDSLLYSTEPKENPGLTRNKIDILTELVSLYLNQEVYFQRMDVK